eukprot:CAMPEP_0180541670 /NCGR_PEP_ID=MMETSP1036_2-20121128/68056_1 /TAXON_ID=632150 /ORGANISM="Azadinium spinosum, Strain 3D9" /LENGTH=94 /DNA_ID=CAMNT_0022556513 /DNA_START=35 /DNA_END=316 /DNA_ORIENTATION=-
MWQISLVIPTLVAITNYLMVEAGAILADWKFGTAQRVMSDSGLGLGIFALVGICALFALAAACLVLFIAPICAGSGIPEAKGYLNGNYIPGMFQ